MGGRAVLDDRVRGSGLGTGEVQVVLHLAMFCRGGQVRQYGLVLPRATSHVAVEASCDGGYIARELLPPDVRLPEVFLAFDGLDSFVLGSVCRVRHLLLECRWCVS